MKTASTHRAMAGLGPHVVIGAAVVATVVATGSGAAAAAPATPEPAAAATSTTAEPVADGSCPALFVFTVQGTGESRVDASTTDVSGMLSEVVTPLMKMAGSLVEAVNVPYDAAFGGAVPGGELPFDQSAAGGADKLTQLASEKLRPCPKSKAAAVGYSQGAYSVNTWAQRVAAGDAAGVSADQVAGVAKLADPTRQQGSTVFAASSGRPQAVPGTNGKNVASLPAVEQPKVDGGGIGPSSDVGNLGPLTGRVGSWCNPGDLACDAPAGSPLVHVVANIAGQSKLNPNDPIAALTSLAQAVATTTIKTAVPLINDDIKAPGNALSSLSYTPGKTISQRLATASDPRTPMPSAQQAIGALFKVGTIGLNAAVTVAKKVLTPDTITSLATVGLANPVAALALLGTKLVGAIVELVPPTTVNRWVGQAFDTLKANVTDNKDLLDVTSLVRYADTANRHGSYGSGGQAADVARWFAAAANDVAGKAFSPTDASGNMSIDTGERFSAATSSSVSSSTTAPTSPSTTTPSTTAPSIAAPTSEPAETPGSAETDLEFDPFTTPESSTSAAEASTAAATATPTPVG